MMSACPVCGGMNTRDVAPFRYQASIFAGCSRSECADCGMMFASPMPSEATLAEYNANYFASAHGGQPTSRSAVAFFKGLARLRLAFLRDFLDERQIPVDTVIEFGPGPGYFAQAWFEGGRHCTYMAVETDRTCHEPLTRIGVKLVAPPAEVPIDLVVMSHVLEHVPDPVEFVRQATAGLRPGGALFIEVPCQDWAHKALDEPHVLFFDKTPMRRLLTYLGFENVKVGYYGQKIRKLKSTTRFRTRLTAIRAKLISWGVTWPFSQMVLGMESLTDPLERAVVAPYQAHEESIEPAWWLRVLAQKK